MNTSLAHYLAEATAKNDVNAVQEFLVQSRYVNVIKQLFATAATNSENGRIVEFCESSANHGSNDNLGKYLIIEILNGNVQSTRFLLENGAKLTGTTRSWDYSPLCSSVFSKPRSRLPMLRLLLDHGLDTGIRSKSGENLLHMFIQHVRPQDRDAVEVVEILTSYGVPIDQPDNEGFSPLHRSISTGNFQLVSLLVKKGADVNAKSKGVTSLHLACRSNDASVIQLLIQSGADVGARTADDKTPLDELKPLMGHEYEECVWIVVKEISKLVYKNIAVCRSFVDVIQSPRFKSYFTECLTELDLMYGLNFHGVYSYFLILKNSKSFVGYSHLWTNDDFVAGFKDNLWLFPRYKTDLEAVLEAAVERTRSSTYFIESEQRRLAENLCINFSANDLYSVMSTLFH